MRLFRDKTNGSLACTWRQAPGVPGDMLEKRAWVQHKTGADDWAGTGRYLNTVRGDRQKVGGQATDYPIEHSKEAMSDRQVLLAFVYSTCAITGCKLPDLIDEPRRHRHRPPKRSFLSGAVVIAAPDRAQRGDDRRGAVSPPPYDGKTET